jgi:lipopolysaccharide/colanic/teichoic acid biosynthesis glycosyltransferase
MDQEFNVMSEDSSKRTSAAEVSAFIFGSIESFRPPEAVRIQSEEHIQKEFDTGSPNLLIDMNPVNRHAGLNDLFRVINKKLPEYGVYIGCFENRKVGSGHKGHPIPDLQEFISDNSNIHPNVRKTEFVPPGGHVTENLIYSKRNKVYSLAEILGRLAFCGFETVNYKVVDGMTFFVTRKKKEATESKDPDFKLLMRMHRVGKGGKIIGVYKIRTMYPYSEYIHDFVIRNNGYNEIGKPSGDFRVTPWGRFIRKVWIDETPQFINLIKGEMNLVGVRPITRYGYSRLPPELQSERIKFKPGIIPPNVALGMKGFHGVIEAEKIYLSEMDRNPLKTNIRYFFKAVFNIITLKANTG